MTQFNEDYDLESIKNNILKAKQKALDKSCKKSPKNLKQSKISQNESTVKSRVTISTIDLGNVAKSKHKTIVPESKNIDNYKRLIGDTSLSRDLTKPILSDKSITSKQKKFEGSPIKPSKKLEPRK